MPFIHGMNSVIFVWDSAGTCRNISGDLNSVTLGWTRDNPDVTTFSHNDIARIAGLRDAQLSGAGVWNTDDTTGIDAVFAGLLSSSVNTLVKWCPGACSSGSPLYTACFLLSQYEVSGPVNGPVGVSYTFQLSSGSLSASSV